MAMSTGGGGDDAPMAEINVTPMVDVLLCLLIIFMVSAPSSPNEQIPLNVPQDSPVQQLDDPNATLLVNIDAQGNATLGTEPLSPDFKKMVDQFKNNQKAQTDGKIAITGEDKTKYGLVIRVMSAAHMAGISEVGVASDRL